MKRLTEKRDNFYYDTDECMISDCSNKLGKLEDLEDELGIDLVTLFKALKNGIWTKSGFCYFGFILEKTPVFIRDIEISYKDYYEIDEDYNTLIEEKNVLCIYECDYEYISRIVRIKDYGRTWALTREELEE